MKKLILFFILINSMFLLFAKSYNIFINEDADEEIVIVNNSSYNEAFKIYIHLKEKEGVNVDVSLFNVDVTIDQKDEWIFLVKSPMIDKNKKWKSTSDYKQIQNSDKIKIETKSDNNYNFNIETNHDKLYIIVTDYNPNDEW